MLLATVLMLVSGAQEGITLDTLLAELPRKRQGIATLEADFIQEKILPDERERTSGRVCYAKPRRIRFEYAEPEMVYLIDDRTVYGYDVELEQVQIHHLTDAPEAEALFLGFTENVAALRKAFDMEILDPSVVEGAVAALELRPKAKADDKPAGLGENPEEAEATNRDHYFERVRLYLRGKDYLPCLIHVVFDADSEVVVQFGDMKVNPETGKERLQMRVPEGTMIIENEELVEVVGPGGTLLPVDPPKPDGSASPEPEGDPAQP